MGKTAQAAADESGLNISKDQPSHDGSTQQKAQMNNRPSTFEFLTITGFGIVILAALGFAVWSVVTLINWTWLLSIAPAFSIAILCVVILAVSAFLGAFDSAFSEAESEGDSTSFE